MTAMGDIRGKTRGLGSGSAWSSVKAMFHLGGAGVSGFELKSRGNCWEYWLGLVRFGNEVGAAHSKEE